MKWIKQIFGIKEDDTQENVDAFLEKRKFANATKTNELVISPNTVNTSEVKKHTKSSLNKMTKVQLEELAKSEFGLEVDRRQKKELIVNEIMNAQ
tara:strand:+ start:3317 stop:3601 length:285 start_codon:yes stop_codon:yes gene_type:complete